jgi:PAS domain-containing protein
MGESGEEMWPSNDISTDAILESISDGVFTVNVNWRITAFNRSAFSSAPAKERTSRLPRR